MDGKNVNILPSLKMSKFKRKNLRNQIYKEKWQLKEQRLTDKCVDRKGPRRP